MPGFNIQTFGCGAGNGTTSGISNTQETARKHRFELSISALDRIYTISAKRIDRPAFEFENIEFHQGPDVVNRPGKNKWHPINIELYDLLDQKSKTAEACYKWLFAPDKGVLDINKSKLTSAKGAYKTVAEVSLLDGFGTSLWKYKLYGAYPQKKQPSELDYSAADIASQVITLFYDKAIEEK